MLQKSSVMSSIPGNTECLNLSLSKVALKVHVKYSKKQNKTKQHKQINQLQISQLLAQLPTRGSGIPKEFRSFPMDAERNEAKVLGPSQMQPQQMKYSQTPLILQRGSNEKPYFFIKSNLCPREYLSLKSKISILLQEARHSLPKLFTSMNAVISFNSVSIINVF